MITSLIGRYYVDAEVAKTAGLEPGYLFALAANIAGPLLVKEAQIEPTEFLDRIRIAGQTPTEAEYTD